MAVDGNGNLYIADRANHRIRKVSLLGLVTTVAGTGDLGSSGDGGPATCAHLFSPFGVAVDANGNLYIADFGNNRIRKVSPSGIITTVVGTGTYGYGGDGGPATSAFLSDPIDVAVDNNGNLYIADRGNHRIRKVNTSGVITTVAGTGTYGYSGDGGPATLAQLNTPYNVAVDASGNIYISDSNNRRIRKVDTAGIITTTAGTGTQGYSGDGGPATSAQLGYPHSLLVDGSGNLYFDDYYNHCMRKVSPSGIITTVAGTGDPGYSGDGGPATSAQLYYPFGIAKDGSGNLYVGDNSNNRVRKIDTSGIITLFAGNGSNGSGGFNGDGESAITAQLSEPSGVAVDSDGNLYIADRANHRIRKVNTSRAITTVAGTGVGGYGGDGNMSIAAQLNNPTGVVIDGSGNLYIADRDNHRIRKVNSSGVITTVVGNGNGGYSGDNGLATNAQLNSPTGIAVDGGGNLYIADRANHRIRKVSTSGIIITVAGIGSNGYSGDGNLATTARLNNPTGLVVDARGNLYIADQSNYCVRKVNPAGVITTVAGTGTQGYSNDGISATSAQLSSPTGVTVDARGNLYIVESYYHRIRKVNTSGIITTVAGSSNGCDRGDCGPAIAARLKSPFGITITDDGNLYIADVGDHRIREVTPANTTVITLKMGSWTDPSVWSCGRIPTSTDTVQINHAVSLPNSYQGHTSIIYYGANGRLLMNTNSSLQLSLP